MEPVAVGAQRPPQNLSTTALKGPRPVSSRCEATAGHSGEVRGGHAPPCFTVVLPRSKTRNKIETYVPFQPLTQLYTGHMTIQLSTPTFWPFILGIALPDLSFIDHQPLTTGHSIGGSLPASHHVVSTLGGRRHPPLFPPTTTPFGGSSPASRGRPCRKCHRSAPSSRLPADTIGGYLVTLT